MLEELHILARQVASSLDQPDKKQLKFNEIVNTAIEFYNDPREGVIELVRSCNKSDENYVAKNPMWYVLKNHYQWMTKEYQVT